MRHTRRQAHPTKGLARPASGLQLATVLWCGVVWGSHSRHVMTLQRHAQGVHGELVLLGILRRKPRRFVARWLLVQHGQRQLLPGILLAHVWAGGAACLLAVRRLQRDPVTYRKAHGHLRRVRQTPATGRGRAAVAPSHAGEGHGRPSKERRGGASPPSSGWQRIYSFREEVSWTYLVHGSRWFTTLCDRNNVGIEVLSGRIGRGLTITETAQPCGLSGRRN